MKGLHRSVASGLVGGIAGALMGATAFFAVNVLMPSAAAANPHTYVHEDGSATRCETRNNTTRCQNLTPEQYIKGVEAKTNYLRKALTTCKGLEVQTYAHDKCHNDEARLKQDLDFNQNMCAEGFGDPFCRWVRDYVADQ